MRGEKRDGRLAEAMAAGGVSGNDQALHRVVNIVCCFVRLE